MSTAPEVPMPEPSIELAKKYGEGKAAQATEADRLAFEAWMRGHCWALSATWRGHQYKSDAEDGGKNCPDAMRTRMLWAAWRDRGAVAADQLRAYADARCEKLQEKIEILQGALEFNRIRAADRDALAEKVKAMEDNDRRYRWLRMNRLWLKANLPMIAAPEFDAAIDAAGGRRVCGR